MADTRSPASRRAAPSAGASRLPSARERRPALAALAVLLIVGGAFASGFLALQAGNRADFLRVKAEVAQGEEITDADLESVSLPEDMEGVISADDQDQVVGTYAVAPLLEGTILTEEMVDDEAGVEPGMVKLAIGVEASELNADLPEGAAITVYTWSDDTEDTDEFAAEVVSVNRADGDSGVGSDGGTSTAQVLVLMSEADAAAVAPAIEDDRVKIGEVSPPQDDNEENANEGGE